MKANVNFFIIPRLVLLRMSNLSDKSSIENQNTFLCSVSFVFENGAVYEIMWKNMVEPGEAQFDNTAHAHFALGTQG
jgi:hypothetical protein